MLFGRHFYFVNIANDVRTNSYYKLEVVLGGKAAPRISFQLYNEFTACKIGISNCNRNGGQAKSDK